MLTKSVSVSSVIVAPVAVVGKSVRVTMVVIAVGLVHVHIGDPGADCAVCLVVVVGVADCL